ncbi:DUF445 domain-containing protein [Hephaestia sp. GCM10023244]|uniref:DUF445 domain-containing protein n=1 Tax=unclassified Hephaestia TaxID=2631281 RepID=UPI0020774F41|nr:DUF445 domain-containing protein [Hephaestia sp. MAHUQ-44]MCM8729720.1 DUF445 domain-containing protein [Hephaestia sp. MAHUQ-44]
MNIVTRPLSLDAASPGLVRMRIIATGLLVLMAALFFMARALEPAHPGFGYLRSFAEAAMVGGLADWFAVTALFRHPLGLPIPHTAIVPRNKDRIGTTLASFLRANFLTPAVVARRMRRVDIASAIGKFLAAPPERGRLWRGASRLIAHVLEALDQERLGGMVKGALAQRLRAINAAPALGRALQAAMKEDRHVPLVDGGIRWANALLTRNEALIRSMVHERSGSILRWTGLDETIANKIIDALDRLLGEMADDPDHPLRLKIEDSLGELAFDLQHDPEMRDRVFRFKAEMLDNPAIERWWMSVWEQIRRGLIGLVRNPNDALAGQFGEALRQLGETLQHDDKLRATINRFVRRAAVGVAADYGDGIVRLVSETVHGWDARTITDRLENAVGRDLQYIRVNGTLVGGLVGLIIHTVDVVL